MDRVRHGSHRRHPVRHPGQRGRRRIPSTGSLERDIAITPDQAPKAAVAARVSAIGCEATPDASASTVAFGTIASYSWDFGDGKTKRTSTSTTTHAYAKPGNHTVTVTSSGGTSVPELTPDTFTGQTMSRNADEQASATATVNLVAPCQAPLPAGGQAPTGLVALGAWLLLAGTFLVYLTHRRRLPRRRVPA